MRIIAFIQDEHSTNDITSAQGIPDFQAPPPIPKYIDTLEALDEIPLIDEAASKWTPCLQEIANVLRMQLEHTIKVALH